ncbi:MAG: ABC transporter ATP-binding protein [Candidatus Odinarchaeum yellowstonii]|uniref:ABC transporter ATP-binding protein n=1 Tax=Odinarchaeota yellowstonii (strain LCB_4) TaxID=1841599 RepID=A0AAF0D2E5_ODILC|nr:MAG: ABC transporter ATP-binding protein [Candidatus Odinarchaeum yellowstonii]
MTENVLLNIRNLKTHFFTEEGVVQALDGVSLEVYEREIIGLVGETGSGKSVTALSVMRLLPQPGFIVEGEIIFKGKPLHLISEEEMRQIRGKEITMIFQDPMNALNPVFTVGNQIAETIMLHNDVTYREAFNQSIELLRRLNIPRPERIVNSYPHELSGGMKQRIQIAIGLACQPALLIADEPTTALDATIEVQVLELIKKLRDEFNTSIMLITHDLGIIAEMCERVVVMYAGSVVEKADVKTIFKNPLHPYTQALLDAIPYAERKKKTKLTTIPGNVPNLINPPSGCRFHPRCKHAMKVCQTCKPLLLEEQPGHWVSCFLYSKNRERGLSEGGLFEPLPGRVIY